MYIYIYIIYIYTYTCTYRIFNVSLLSNEVYPRPKFSKVSLMLIFPRKMVQFLESQVYYYCVSHTWYAVATISRLLKIIGLFHKRAL